MKLSLNSESANALRELAESIPIAIQNLIESTLKVIIIYQSVSETLGEHRRSFYDLLLLIKKTQENTAETIEILPQMLNSTADKIDAYVAMTKTALTNNSHQTVNGDNIVNSFCFDSSKYVSAAQQAAAQQGFLGLPRIVGAEEFNECVKTVGLIGFRTLNSGNDVLSGEMKSAHDFKEQFKSNTIFSLNGNGMQVYGSGIYITANHNSTPGIFPDEDEINIVKSESINYGQGESPATISMTFAPDIRIEDFDMLQNEFLQLPRETCAKYGGEGSLGIAAYAISKGIDALRTNDDEICDYIMVYNRTKLIVLDD